MRKYLSTMADAVLLTIGVLASGVCYFVVHEAWPHAVKGDPVAIGFCFIFGLIGAGVALTWMTLLFQSARPLLIATLWRRRYQQYQALCRQDEHAWVLIKELDTIIMEMFDVHKDDPSIRLRPVRDVARAGRIQELELLQSRLSRRSHQLRTQAHDLQFTYDF